MNSVTSCCEFGVVIDDDTKAVQCERCVCHETWKCASCLDYTDDLYELLASSSKCIFIGSATSANQMSLTLLRQDIM